MADPTPSTLPGQPAGPAVEFAEWLPALGGSRLLRVHGEASTNTAPTLVLNTPAGEHRIEPRATSRFTRAHEWRASYLIASELVMTGWSETSLEWPDGVRLALPDPPAEPRAEVIDPSVLASLRALRFPRPAPADLSQSPAADPARSPAADLAPSPAADPASSSAAGPAPSPAADPTRSSAADPAPASPADLASPAADPAPTPAADPARSPAADAAPASPADLAPSPPADAAPSSPPAAPASAPPVADAASPPAADVASPPPASYSAAARSWADPPDLFAGSVFEAEAVWTAKRAELERELSRAADAIARAVEGERAARDAVLAALASVRADLRAARAARAADQSTIAALSAELEAERIAHAVARRTAADLRTELVQARHERAANEAAGTQLEGAQRDAAVARGEAEGLRTALEAERSARANVEETLRETREEGSELMRRIAELNRAASSDGDAIARRAREHAEFAAAAARRPQQETGELVANLAAAAATFRASRPSDESPQAGDDARSRPAAPDERSGLARREVAEIADAGARDGVAALGGAAAGGGDVTATAGDVAASLGDAAASADGVAALAGDVAASAGGVAASAGDVVTSAGDVAASAGDVAAWAGDVAVSAGDVTASPDDVGAPADDLAAPAGSAERGASAPAPERSGDAGDDEPAIAAPRPLRRVLVALAERDPVIAGEILVGLLPAQGSLFEEALAYDLTIDGIGTFAVTVKDGIAAVERMPKARSRRRARFELRSDALTLAELLAGEERRIGRFAGRARVSRRRRKARVLRALPASGISLADAVRSGARLEPAHVYAALPYAIDPSWTSGHAFTVAQQITEPEPRTWYLTVRDGGGVTVSESERPADATVTMTRAAFDRLLRDEPAAAGDRPLVRGDRAAVALLKAWTDRARGAA